MDVKVSHLASAVTSLCLAKSRPSVPQQGNLDISAWPSQRVIGRYATRSHNKDGGRIHIQSRETIGQENHVTCLKLRPRLNFVPRFLEPIPRHVFSINTSSSNTLSLFPNFHCSADTLSPGYSPTEVKSPPPKKKWISLLSDKFCFAAWNIGFAFGAARRVERLCFLRRN